MADDLNQIIAGCRSGDHRAQRSFYDHFHRRVLGLAYRIGGPQEAVDLTQDIFLKIFQGIGKFQGNADISTWVYRVAVNECLRQRRRGTVPAKTMVQEPPSHEASPGQTLELQDFLESALEQLDKPLKIVFLLREAEELSYNQIAAILGIPAGTVASQLNRARADLQAIVRRHRTRSVTMNCEQVQKLLGRFHDGELTSAERTAIEIHLGSCSLCLNELAGLAELAQWTKNRPIPEPPEFLWGRISARLNNETRNSLGPRKVSRRFQKSALIAALLLLSLGIGWWIYRSRSPEPNIPADSDTFAESSPDFEEILGYRLDNPISLQEAARQVDFRLMASPQLPEGYSLERCCKVKCGFCDMVGCKYLRGKDALVMVQSGKDSPIHCGNGCQMETRIHGKNVRIMQCEKCMGISWQTGGTVVLLVGPQDLTDLIRLMTYVDGKLAASR